MQLDLRKELLRYGAGKDAVKLLDVDKDASLLRYVDLFPESAARKTINTPMPSGVVEHDDRPLMYLYRADALANAPANDTVVAELIRELACRGEGDYLAVVYPGELEVYPIALLKKSPQPQRFRADSAAAPMLIPELAAGIAPESLRQQTARAKSLHKLLFELITSVAIELRESKVLSTERAKDEVLPLVGRAIFARFLIDRGIINSKTFPELYTNNATPELAFSTAELAARTCAWLDEKFNGELLPLLFGNAHPTYDDYLVFFSRKGIAKSRVLHELTNVMYRAPLGRLSLALSWEGVDFAHVPIGLLSEVYEDYAQRFYRDDAERESVRYTPRHIAEFTVANAFEGLPVERRALARVLDPAAGAGIFLVLTLQRLVAENWRATGKRPDTADIRRILNEQVRGYDINHSALTLAALSLYLTSLELDPDPFPPEKLKFDPLIESVLVIARTPSEPYPQRQLVLGSMGPMGNLAAGDPGFDIVTGNPPWTTYADWGTKEYNFNHYVKDMVRRLITVHRSGNAELAKVAEAYEHNDKLPDTAFLWRSMEWAKPDGVIAFILAGRLLFKRADGGTRVRNALFKSFKVTGILNGSLLLKLWPAVNQPFCILFAKNRAPELTDRFTLVTPVLDPAPAKQFRMRIDHESRQPIDLKTALQKPYLFKVVTRGGRLDLDIVERIQRLAKAANGSELADGDPGTSEPSTVSISKYWNGDWTEGRKAFGQGYKPPGEKAHQESEKTRKRVKELVDAGAHSLSSDDLTDSTGAVRIGLRISPRHLEPFQKMKLHRLANPSIFDPPLVIINEGFGKSPEDIRARLYLGSRKLAFKRNFYGFSTAGHPRPVQMAKYLFCVINSELFGYYTLQASAKFGVERRTLLCEDIKAFPIRQDLTERQWQQVETVADELDLDNQKSWRAMNRTINSLYGLTPIDEQVMADTLATKMPYAEAELRAYNPATGTEIERFRSTLAEMLQPSFSEDGVNVNVTVHKMPVQGWTAFDIATETNVAGAKDDLVTTIAAQLADDEGASRVFQKVGTGHLRLAVRNQYRYLTLSRARLCAIDALRDHGSVFPMKDHE